MCVCVSSFCRLFVCGGRRVDLCLGVGVQQLDFHFVFFRKHGLVSKDSEFPEQYYRPYNLLAAHPYRSRRHSMPTKSDNRFVILLGKRLFILFEV